MSTLRRASTRQPVTNREPYSGLQSPSHLRLESKIFSLSIQSNVNSSVIGPSDKPAFYAHLSTYAAEDVCMPNPWNILPNLRTCVLDNDSRIGFYPHGQNTAHNGIYAFNSYAYGKDNTYFHVNCPIPSVMCLAVRHWPTRGRPYWQRSRPSSTTVAYL